MSTMTAPRSKAMSISEELASLKQHARYLEKKLHEDEVQKKDDEDTIEKLKKQQ